MSTFRLFLNYACNAKCPFCFNPPEPSQREWHGLPLPRVVASLQAAYGEGRRAVSFIGGEPTVRPDFLKILAAARRVGFQELQLVTNGVRLAEPGYAASALRAGLGRVDVSIHAHEAALHDRQVGLPGAFEKAVRTLDLLARGGARVGINCVVNRTNYRILPEFAAHFAARGVRNFSFFGLRYLGHMALSGNLERMRVPASQTVPYLRRALEVLDRAGCLPTIFISDYTPCLLPDQVDRLTDWEAGSNPDGHADPDGALSASEHVCSEGKRRVPACAACRYGSRCFGVESGYLSQFGDAEFQAVAP